MTALTALPKEILARVLSFGDSRSQANCASANKELSTLLNEPAYAKDFKSSIHSVPKDALTHILSFGNNKLLANCAGVHRGWNNLLHEPENISASHAAWRTACQWAKSQTLKIRAADDSPHCDLSKGKVTYNSGPTLFICDLSKISDPKKVLKLIAKDLPQETLQSGVYGCKTISSGEGHVLIASDFKIEMVNPLGNVQDEAILLCQQDKAKFAYDPQRGLAAFPQSDTNSLTLLYASGHKINAPLPINLAANMHRYVNTCINGDLIFLCSWKQNVEAGRREGIINVFSIKESRFVREIVYLHRPIQIMASKDRLLVIEDDAYFSLYDLNSFELIIDSQPLPDLEHSAIWEQAMDDEKIVFGTIEGNVFVYSSLDGQLLKKFKASERPIRELVLLGNTIAVKCPTGVKLFDLDSGDPVHHVPVEIISSLSLEGKTLAFRDSLGEITVNRPTPNPKRKKNERHTSITQRSSNPNPILRR